ncbi:TfoX/Sxy family DNA transformation protein [Plesiomonas sp.]|uniref:TfoX/Sxy family DNA transformation protein n=1 Tax=Plesiomonas sp. TaxID=2486279 RepID=UPI003F2D194B
MNAVDKDLIRKACEIFSVHFGEVKSRSMFGGFGLYQGDVMFAVVSEDYLYLRACNGLEARFIARGMAPFVYTKRGRPVMLRYYKVDQMMWDNLDQLVVMANQALIGARNDKQEKKGGEAKRLKDLPNMGLSTERLLRKAGIGSISELQALGAVAAYVKVKAQCSDVTEKLLWALAGALEGCHAAALSPMIKDQITVSLREAYAFNATAR